MGRLSLAGEFTSKESSDEDIDGVHNKGLPTTKLELKRVTMPPLFGWLMKEHASSTVFSWGRRWVCVNDKRGEVWYSKGKECKPSAVMPLADVTVTKAETDDLSFVVSCPPMRLTLRASDAIELAVWMSSLQECAGAWKRKVEEDRRRCQRA